jgi:hypothetical protein
MGDIGAKSHSRRERWIRLRENNNEMNYDVFPITSRGTSNIAMPMIYLIKISVGLQASNLPFVKTTLVEWREAYPSDRASNDFLPFPH